MTPVTITTHGGDATIDEESSKTSAAARAIRSALWLPAPEVHMSLQCLGTGLLGITVGSSSLEGELSSCQPSRHYSSVAQFLPCSDNSRHIVLAVSYDIIYCIRCGRVQFNHLQFLFFETSPYVARVVTIAK